ncbi:uncharacterized protein A1O5_04066 [Cladophialophora psammophila CBS 110553]|uniref:Uncharacterized protein n=1 Tax=Cladophialophora psammophila CBS 110553 TaxID=1182543 RepID=W9WYB1_9EURO|nr:uncharacterized protein A1O5_04066 [Cladophialophora psammophila CBS 110553]EXJ72918.1 hypothetical protein A1O5_04066 [Cladophialophora psammophila CBS 110553]
MFMVAVHQRNPCLLTGSWDRFVRNLPQPLGYDFPLQRWRGRLPPTPQQKAKDIEQQIIALKPEATQEYRSMWKQTQDEWYQVQMDPSRIGMPTLVHAAYLVRNGPSAPYPVESSDEGDDDVLILGFASHPKRARVTEPMAPKQSSAVIEEMKRWVSPPVSVEHVSVGQDHIFSF